MTCNNREYYGGEVEAINVQEILHSELLRMGMIPEAAFDIATGTKYLRRAGKKSGEDFETDIHKAATYFFRGANGEWPCSERVGGTD